MKAPTISYRRARTLDEALEVLGDDSDAWVLAGGQSLLPMLNMRLVHPEVVLDIADIAELRELRLAGADVSVGALVTYRMLELSSLVAAEAPLVRAAVGYVGDLQVRNRGTAGGSLAQGDPTAEFPLACLVLGASVRVNKAGAERTVPMAELLVGPYETALERDELLTEVLVPSRSKRFAFAEATRRHNDFAIVSAAATGSVGPDGRLEDLTLGFGGVADTVVLAPRAVAALTGQVPDEDSFSAAVEALQEEIDPGDDTRASAEYRRHLVGEYLRRVVAQLAYDREAAA